MSERGLTNQWEPWQRLIDSIVPTTAGSSSPGAIGREPQLRDLDEGAAPRALLAELDAPGLELLVVGLDIIGSEEDRPREALCHYRHASQRTPGAANRPAGPAARRAADHRSRDAVVCTIALARQLPGAFLGPSVVTMLGFGMAFVPLTMAGMAGVPPDRAGIASGVFNTSRQVGGAIGLAALAALATIAATRTKAVLAAGHVTHATVLSAMTAGYTRAFAIGAIVATCAGFIATLAAREAPRSTGWWRHAICAALGQPWRCEQPEPHSS